MRGLRFTILLALISGHSVCAFGAKTPTLHPQTIENDGFKWATGLTPKFEETWMVKDISVFDTTPNKVTVCVADHRLLLNSVIRHGGGQGKISAWLDCRPAGGFLSFLPWRGTSRQSSKLQPTSSVVGWSGTEVFDFKPRFNASFIGLNYPAAFETNISPQLSLGCSIGQLNCSFSGLCGFLCSLSNLFARPKQQGSRDGQDHGEGSNYDGASSDKKLVVNLHVADKSFPIVIGFLFLGPALGLLLGVTVSWLVGLIVGGGWFFLVVFLMTRGAWL